MLVELTGCRAWPLAVVPMRDATPIWIFAMIIQPHRGRRSYAFLWRGEVKGWRILTLARSGSL
ncbi:MAG TPA: hypothetical protein VII47_09910 [Actinomycetota bacterium]